MTGEVLYRAAGVVAVAKPAGVLVIPGRTSGRAPSLREELEDTLKSRVWVVHRIDRDTSGIVLFALNEDTHRELSKAFEAGRVEKRYWALVEGTVDGVLECDRALVPARRGRMRLGRPSEQGKPARTRVVPMEQFARATWVEAIPLTGRTHQIRVHLAGAGHPLLLDHQYGRAEPIRAEELGGTTDEVVLARTPLHAVGLRIPPVGSLPAAEIAAPLPADIERTLQLLRGARSR